MSTPPAVDPIVTPLDAETRALIELAAAIATADESGVRAALSATARVVRAEWVEELILQSYLFVGFPRTLNAAREWRRASGRAAPPADADAAPENIDAWAARGERTCATVYGGMYERLRANIRALHPALDTWMIVDGYGKVLGRPALDLKRRELCIVAVCAVTEQDRQLHAHLHGAVNAGATPAEVAAALRLIAPRLGAAANERFAQLWARVERML